ncbi:MAG: 30S ribosome-binding factor RbfA [Myxococcota bacterium]
MSRRTERVAELLRAEIAMALREDVTDPRIGLVTLTRVDVAPDMSHAIIGWSALEVDAEGRVAEIKAGLDSAAGHLRSAIAKRLELRRMPELRFRHDSSIALGDKTLEVLEHLSDGKIS